MEPRSIITDLNLVEGYGTRFGAGDEAVAIDGVVFEAAPERLDEGVGVAVSFAAQRGDKLVRSRDGHPHLVRPRGG